MLMESGIGCCCPKDDALFWKNRHIDAMKQLIQVRQENLELRKQHDVDLAIKKDLDEKLDKATADYHALWVENEERINNAAKSYAKLANERNNLAETISRMEKTIRDLDERNGTLRERLGNINASLKRSIQENSKLRSDAAYIDKMKKAQEKEIERLRMIVNASNGSCSAYTQQGMQSKIAKQANEIKRLTEENRKLGTANRILDAACDRKDREIENYKKALDIAAKDADANFERGKIKGMEEIWDELRDCYNGRPTGENKKIFGYYIVGDILMNLSPTWFINKAEEYHKQEEKKEQQAKDIQIGDEVEIFDTSCPDDDPHSDIGIVLKIDSERRIYVVVGPNFEGCFDEDDIQSGAVRKTGQHFDSIPLNYLA